MFGALMPLPAECFFVRDFVPSAIFSTIESNLLHVILPFRQCAALPKHGIGYRRLSPRDAIS